MSEEVASPASREAPFMSSPTQDDGQRGGTGRAASGSILFAGGGGSGSGSSGAQRTPVTVAAGKSNRNTSFAGVNDGDPYALIYTNPAHAPPSLAQRAHNTETLFQYYSQRGYKELLNELNSSDAAKATETCLEGKADAKTKPTAAAPVAGAAGTGSSPLRGETKKSTQPKNTHVIDRCLAEAPTTVPVPLRPPHAQDKSSIYRTQQADEARAQATAKRRAHLHQPPTEHMYAGRYYPPSADVLPSVSAKRTSGGADKTTGGGAAGSPTGAVPRTSPSISLSQSASLVPGSGRSPASAKPDGRAGRTPSLTVPLRTPQEMAAAVEQQRDARRQLEQQIDECFVAAYHLRDPAAAKRARERESEDVARRTSQAAAELLGGTGNDAAAAKKRASSAAAALSDKKKRKSTAGARSTSGLSKGEEGGVPLNMKLFRSALLLLSNEDGAVTLDQLGAVLAQVPFNVVSTSSAVTAAAGTASGNAVQRLFRTLHPNTRAPNAADATDLLLAVASATTSGGIAGRLGGPQGDNSLSYGTGNTNNTTAAAASRNGAGRRAMGASISSSAVTANANANNNNGALSTRPPRASILGTSRSMGSPAGATTHLPATSVSFASNAHSPKMHAPGTSAAWTDSGSPLTSPGRQQQQLLNASPPDLKDSRKCVLVLELLDALNGLLNSPETKNVVRWECFNVLAAEGNGYVHKSQLEQQRRHAYRDGSAAEMNTPVTASMVRALEDAFTIIAAEEEAAFVKANKKGRKGGGGGGAGAGLYSNQKSVIPLHMMRKTHMDFPLFCRFFDELPQIPAAFAHVWLPLLMTGARHSTSYPTTATAGGGGGQSRSASAGGDGEEGGRAIPMEGVLSVEDDTAAKRYSSASRENAEETSSVASGGVAESVARTTAKASVAGLSSTTSNNEEGFPLELLGTTAVGRQVAIQHLLTRRLEELQEACDALDKEKLQNEPSGGSGAFGNSDMT